MSELVVIGLSHHRTPVEIRERIAVSADDGDRLLKSLIADGLIDEGLMLSTCNRTELMVSVGDAAVVPILQERLVHGHGFTVHELKPYWYAVTGTQAIHHIFRVTASLDAMVVGEAQILGQVKEAYHRARQLGVLQHVLHRTLQRAFSVAKQVRSQTQIARLPVSVSAVAVELAEQLFGSLSGRRVLLVGTGEMSRLTAVHLKEAGALNVMVVSRGGDHAQEFATEFGAVLWDWSDMAKALLQADIVIASTRAEIPVITPEMLAPILPKRANPIFCIDIAIPRNIDPRVNTLDDVYLYNIDDLQKVVTANQATRHAEAERAEGMVEEAVQSFVQELRVMQVVPAITSLHQRCEDIRKVEVEKVLARFPNATPDSREMLETCTQAVVAKILHQPVVNLKETHVNGRDEDRSPALDFFRRLFGLET
jgi:glutamyl-tRNA reductase